MVGALIYVILLIRIQDINGLLLPVNAETKALHFQPEFQVPGGGCPRHSLQLHHPRHAQQGQVQVKDGALEMVLEHSIFFPVHEPGQKSEKRNQMSSIEKG